MTLIQRVSKDVANFQIANTIKISPAALFCKEVHSVQQKSKDNSSRFTFQMFVRSWRFSVLHSLQSITPTIY